jgi:hypothetical protein
MRHSVTIDDYIRLAGVLECKVQQTSELRRSRRDAQVHLYQVLRYATASGAPLIALDEAGLALCRAELDLCNGLDAASKTNSYEHERALQIAARRIIQAVIGSPRDTSDAAIGAAVRAWLADDQPSPTFDDLDRSANEMINEVARKIAGGMRNR